jgi:hypothetical protein
MVERNVTEVVHVQRLYVERVGFNGHRLRWCKFRRAHVERSRLRVCILRGTA